MIKEAPGPINFTVFLTMFGEKLKGERAAGGSVGTNTITNILSHLGKPHSSQGLHHPSREIPQMVLGGFRWEPLKESKWHWLLYCGMQSMGSGMLPYHGQEVKPGDNHRILVK